MTDPVRAYVALGANMGDPRAQVLRAMRALDGLAGTRLVAKSGLYVTPPWGVTRQPDFINAAAALDTTLGAYELLHALQALEADAGRRRDGTRNGPRPLDLDLLLYGRMRGDDTDLQIPHPRMHQRAFVLLPLAEIAATEAVPGRGTVRDLLATVDASGCRRLDAAPTDGAT